MSDSAGQPPLGPVEGRPLPCGHYLPEEQPEATAEALARFFAAG